MYKKVFIINLVTYSVAFFSQSTVDTLQKNAYIKDSLKTSSPDIVKSIEELKLVSKKAAFKMEAGKTSIHLESALVHPEGSLLDALNRLAGVQVQNDGTVQLNGQTGTSLMIDGKLTYLSGENLSSFLKSLPVSSIETIELISHPSARFDASGTGGIINIIRKKNFRKGYSVRASSSIEGGKYTRTTQTAGAMFNSGKISISADYTYYGGDNFTKVYSSRSYFLPHNEPRPPLTLVLDAFRKYRYGSHFLSSGIDYKINESWNLSSYVSMGILSRTKRERSCLSV